LDLKPYRDIRRTRLAGEGHPNFKAEVFSVDSGVRRRAGFTHNRCTLREHSRQISHLLLIRLFQQATSGSGQHSDAPNWTTTTTPSSYMSAI
jgi:hypothetical protein